MDAAGATLPTPAILISSAGPDVQIIRALVKPMAAHNRVFSSQSTHGTLRASFDSDIDGSGSGGGGGGRLQLLGRESKLGYGVSVDGGAMVADGAEVLLAEGVTVTLLQHRDPEQLPPQAELDKYPRQTASVGGNARPWARGSQLTWQRPQTHRRRTKVILRLRTGIPRRTIARAAIAPRRAATTSATTATATTTCAVRAVAAETRAITAPRFETH